MSQFLKGNFETVKKVTGKKNKENLEEEFERTARAKLGGSIAFVSRKKFLWKGDKEDAEKKISVEGRAQQYDNQ